MESRSCCHKTLVRLMFINTFRETHTFQSTRIYTHTFWIQLNLPLPVIGKKREWHFVLLAKKRAAQHKGYLDGNDCGPYSANYWRNEKSTLLGLGGKGRCQNMYISIIADQVLYQRSNFMVVFHRRYCSLIGIWKKGVVTHTQPHKIIGDELLYFIATWIPF